MGVGAAWAEIVRGWLPLRAPRSPFEVYAPAEAEGSKLVHLYVSVL